MENAFWDKKLFKDPVHGYISVPRLYVEKLIDTRHMQRIKGVAQAGIRPLFSAATHDRFSHSLGVYMFAHTAYKNLSTNILALLENNICKISENDLKELKNDLKKWRCLVDIAALLHDIGHPAGSHAFEFLYDDIFLQFDNEEGVIDISTETLWLKQLDYNKKVYSDIFMYKEEKSDASFYEKSLFKEKLGELLLELDKDNDIEGSPHERMSAYMILSDKELNKTIGEVIEICWKEKVGIEAASCAELDEAIQFICRMIIGKKYSSTYRTTFSISNYKNSMKNCVISLINGVLDADSLDYLMRNSYSAGYSTYSIDYSRLSSSFTVVEKFNTIEPCLSKSVLSVVEGFITARHFEPKWLYSHHKVVYYDVLIKSLYHYTVKYLCYLDFSALSNEKKKELTNQYNPEKKNNENNEDKFRRDTKYEAEYYMSNWSYPYYAYILAPILKFYGSRYEFEALVDSDLDSLFKSVKMDLEKIISDHIQLENDAKSIFNTEDLEIFNSLLKEYESRNLKKSIWKSYTEYRLILKEVGTELGIPVDTVHQFMMDMVRYGLFKWNFAIDLNNLSEGKLVDREKNQKDSKTYIEQYIYRPYNKDEYAKPTTAKDGVKDYIHKNIFDVFDNIPGEYDLSHNMCSCKIYKGKFKDFSGLSIKVGNQAYDLCDIIDIVIENTIEFPYIYYSKESRDNKDPEEVRRNFVKRFSSFCAGRLDYEAGLKRRVSMVNTLTNQHVIRDVVHGDITFTNEFWDIVNTKEFQRLRRIKQLAMASQVFPNAVHTRFAHSIGTYHVMKLIIDHFKCIFNELKLDDTNKNDEQIALLTALLHDIGHGPFSHAFEEVADNSIKHEEWAERIILDSNTELHRKIVKNFGKDAPQKVIDCMSNVVNKTDGQINFSMIYSSLVSGALDADRMDYLVRDAYNTTRQFNSIDIQNIISSMRIAQIDDVNYVCYDEGYMSYIEQLIFTRYEMYDNIYFNSYKVLTESLLKNILQRAYAKRDLLDEHESNLLYSIFNGEISTVDYLTLDDNVVSYYFHKWKYDTKDEVLQGMCRALIDRTGYDEIQISNQSETSFRNLFSDIRKLIENDEGASYGLIKEIRSKEIYTKKDNTNPSKVIWIMKRNGTVSDFKDCSRMYNTSDFKSLYIHKSYGYYDRSVLKVGLKEFNVRLRFEEKEEIDVDNKISEIDNLISREIPRNHIEIEEKYVCQEDVLKEIEDNLKAGVYNPFIIGSGLNEIEQTDVYYDTRDGAIEKSNCSIRLRRKSKGYICTVKLPVNSDNFGKASQYARFEYEAKGDSDDISEYAEFINKNLRINDKPVLKEVINSTTIGEVLIKIIEISNKRKKATIKRNVEGDKFSCEVCLDRVVYMRDSVSENDYQVEVELKSDYLHHLVLKIFTNKLESGFKDRMYREEKSKYLRGLKLTENKN